MNDFGVLKYISDNLVGFTFLSTLIAGIVNFWQWLSIKRAEERQRRFESFHKLVKDLVEPEERDKAMRLDRQVAIIFELTKYAEYYPVSKRILEGLLISWGETKANQRLIDEINISLKYIKTVFLFRCFVER